MIPFGFMAATDELLKLTTVKHFSIQNPKSKI